jgi:hypothetical protein
MNTLKLTASGDLDLVMTRAFDAPPYLVFDAFTKPELVRRWLLGPQGWSIPVCEVDLKVDGKYRYVWRRDDFPSMGIWKENSSRQQPPWNGATLTRGMEFGVSPFPESRREMIERRRVFETPGFRWIPAATRVSVEYWALLSRTDTIPETLEPPM